MLNDCTVEDFDVRPIEYNLVNEKIAVKRKMSMDYLINALKDCR